MDNLGHLKITSVLPTAASHMAFTELPQACTTTYSGRRSTKSGQTTITLSLMKILVLLTPQRKAKTCTAIPLVSSSLDPIQLCPGGRWLLPAKKRSMPPPLHALLPPLLLLLSASTTGAVYAMTTVNGERRPALSARIFVPGINIAWLPPDGFK